MKAIAKVFGEKQAKCDNVTPETQDTQTFQFKVSLAGTRTI